MRSGSTTSFKQKIGRRETKHKKSDLLSRTAKRFAPPLMPF
ncbi:Uncharacterized protein dnm_092370 [Desulfonema magnum]|uniref:Uncharacterized protein n=1 Tax=Desulfonema magnum TaxID=45655 RepID=A0A975BWM5_9BACT|nr:Uncharacterized protein dnm_092370 [Desulfonema magnum]